MKAKVIVTLKDGVLDPQGAAIRRALAKMGRKQVEDVRQGKYFEIDFGQSTDLAEARRLTEVISRQVLSNPIIEKFVVEDIQ